MAVPNPARLTFWLPEVWKIRPDWGWFLTVTVLFNRDVAVLFRAFGLVLQPVYKRLPESGHGVRRCAGHNVANVDAIATNWRVDQDVTDGVIVAGSGAGS